VQEEDKSKRDRMTYEVRSVAMGVNGEAATGDKMLIPEEPAESEVVGRRRVDIRDKDFKDCGLEDEGIS
jgi:hypothetical protein